MAERLEAVPARLREAAERHQQTAEYLRTVPSTHGALQESLDSLGPIFAAVRESGRELLDRRSQCYQRQAEEHACVADALLVAAATWEQHEQEASIALTELGSAVGGGQ